MPPDPSQPHPVQVDPQLAAVIAEIESSQFPYALRFEPGIATFRTDLIIKIKSGNMCDYKTAEILYAMSFGKYQIMGYNLYSIGFNGALATFLADASLQLWYLSDFLVCRGINYRWAQLKSDSTLRALFARTYNGSVAYGDLMLKKAAEINL